MRSGTTSAEAPPTHMAIERAARVLGLDPDAPRGLRTVTRTDA